MQNRHQFKENLFESLRDMLGKKLVQLHINNQEYKELIDRQEALFRQIIGILPKSAKELVYEYEEVKNLADGYETDLVYMQGLKDAVKILKMLGVL